MRYHQIHTVVCEPVSAHVAVSLSRISVALSLAFLSTDSTSYVPQSFRGGVILLRRLLRQGVYPPPTKKVLLLLPRRRGGGQIDIRLRSFNLDCWIQVWNVENLNVENIEILCSIAKVGMLKCWKGVQCWNVEDVEMLKMLKCWNAAMLRCWNVDMLKCWSVEMLECWNVEMYPTLPPTLYPGRV